MTNVTQQGSRVVLRGEGLRAAKPVFPPICVVCGEQCNSDRVTLKAWSGNLVFFGELSPTLHFEVPAHTDEKGCAARLVKQWKMYAYTPMVFDALIIVTCAPLALYSFPLSLISGGALLLANSVFKAYLMMYRPMSLKITQEVAGLSTNYRFVFLDKSLADAFGRANSTLLVD